MPIIPVEEEKEEQEESTFKDEVLYSETKEGLRMAPNSNFDYAVSLGKKPFKPGKYTFKGVAQSGDKKWNFEKDFEIKGNKESVSVEKDNTWLYFLIGDRRNTCSPITCDYLYIGT
ncbi:WxL protein host-binding domain-containing protein [Lactococcus garvieae]|uniref:WxL protein host-binding domain-containing protein n=1 Tax=Lactococcus garvieae TaxID=1363 RepID=UPI00398EEE42